MHRVIIQGLDSKAKETITFIVNVNVLLKEECEENGGGFKRDNAEHWTELELSLRHLADRATRLACGIRAARAGAHDRDRTVLEKLTEELAY